MGDKDAITKEFMSRPDVFADAFNFLIYDGEQVIKPENLREMDTSARVLPYGIDGIPETSQKTRDVFKSWVCMRDDQYAYLMLGIENQSEIHYAMPVRNMLYDAMQYSQQIGQRRKSLKKSGEQGADSGEYLSGFHKDDKLTPVITLVVYFGSDEWDAPLSLHEMMSVQDERVMRLVADYRLNLIAPAHLTEDEAHKLCSELREVMLAVKYAGDRQRLRTLLHTDDRFADMEKSAADVVMAFTGMETKNKTNEKGRIDMRFAVDEIREEARGEGIEQGIEQGINNMVRAMRMLHYSEQQILELVMAAFHLTAAEAEAYLDEPEETEEN